MRPVAPNEVIAIDGPAAAGKSTVAQALASEIGALFFDTGTLYRAVTLIALNERISLDDGEALAGAAWSHQIDIRPPTVADGRLYDVLVDGEDVTWRIRDNDVNAAVSAVSAHQEVRNALLAAQRRIAGQGRVVVVGRDIGTVVVPDASVKIFLIASPEERARRRHREQVDRGDNAVYADVLADILRRDRTDTERDAAPLRAAPDATIVSTDGFGVPEVVDQLRALVDHVLSQHHQPTQ